MLSAAPKIYIKRLNRNSRIDWLGDLAKYFGAGGAAAIEASELMLNPVEYREASERAWESIHENIEAG